MPRRMTNSGGTRAEQLDSDHQYVNIDDAYAAYDQLPPKVQRVLNESDFQISAIDVLAAINQGATEDQVIDGVRRLVNHLNSKVEAMRPSIASNVELDSEDAFKQTVSKYFPEDP